MICKKTITLGEFRPQEIYICYLPRSWKFCPRPSPRSQFFTIRTDAKPVNNLFIFFQALKRKKNSRKKKITQAFLTVVRDRKIRTALRTNQIVGFVTVPAWKKINIDIVRNLSAVESVYSSYSWAFIHVRKTDNKTFQCRLLHGSCDKVISIFDLSRITTFCFSFK